MKKRLTAPSQLARDGSLRHRVTHPPRTELSGRRSCDGYSSRGETLSDGSSSHGQRPTSTSTDFFLRILGFQTSSPSFRSLPSVLFPHCSLSCPTLRDMLLFVFASATFTRENWLLGYWNCRERSIVSARFPRRRTTRREIKTAWAIPVVVSLDCGD